MGAKQAVAAAKQHLTEVFADELTSPPTLEEVWFDDNKNEWSIALGVRRPSNFIETETRLDPLLGKAGRTVPDYKVVRISDKTGAVRAVLNREAVST